MTFEEIDPFKKDLKKLIKKYRSLDDDLRIVKKILQFHSRDRPPFSFRLDNLGIETCILKVKKIASKSIPGKGVNSGLRLVYGHFEEAEKIVFIEIYHKSVKAREDRQRIIDHFK